MKWDKKFAIGILTIDAQHKQIIAGLDELEQALKQGIKGGEIDGIFELTRQYTVRHFTLEEKYMTESHYPGLAEQKAAHEYFIQRFGRIVEDYKRDGLSAELVHRLKNELSGWIKEHVTGLDCLFAAYYKKRQTETSP